MQHDDDKLKQESKAKNKKGKAKGKDKDNTDETNPDFQRDDGRRLRGDWIRLDNTRAGHTNHAACWLQWCKTR